MTRQRQLLIPFIAALGLLAGCANAPEYRDGAVSQPAPSEAEADQTFMVTGSRIRRSAPADDRAALSSSSHIIVFSREDLETTGRSDVGSALKQLHPAFY